MSKGYSFRLDDDNPREAQARGVIKAWMGEVYSLRHIITDAVLINFDKKYGDDEVYILLEQIRRTISELGNTASLEIKNESEFLGLLKISFAK